ncbi:GNAT family N-acetyltransferase [Paenibacillus sp. GCM10027626]|uniref:GNAT family N-acetyltransferase n=1 Tax=Paenibacillus sp. GCM10027626 TaxID=3273411 RepID=UPI0036441870
MTAAQIMIEPMQLKYNPQVGQLLVHGFRGKFQHLTNLNDEELALFFEKLFDQYPAEPAGQRMVAVQGREVVGTLSLKWKVEADRKQEKQKLPSWKNFNMFSKWNLLKMLVGLYFLDHKPEAGECYIADVVVHPDHRGKGVGKLLLERAHQFVLSEPRLDRLSLYVSGKNPRAKHLYEQLSFQTHLQENSYVWHFLFNELEWEYMVNVIKG